MATPGVAAAQCPAREEMLKTLELAIAKRRATFEFLISVASSALQSLRAPTVARPIPFDLDTAQLALRSVSLDSDGLSSLPKETVELLHFLLHPDVISIRKMAVSKWAASVPGSKSFLPDAVFELDYGLLRPEYPNQLARMKHAEFSKAKERFPLQIAYHGTELCNVHNILRESLKNDRNLAGRNGQVFGKGIYLSTDAGVAQNFLHYGKPWNGAHDGSSMACLLECEVVMSDLATETPEKYLVVQNDCLVRVRRVLLYHERNTQRDWRWVGRALVILVALVLLAMMLLKNKSSALSRFLIWQTS